MKKSGVSHYTKGRLSMLVSFPNDEVTCANCILLQEVRGAFPRFYCIAQHGERIFYPENGIDLDCPLDIENEVK